MNNSGESNYASSGAPRLRFLAEFMVIAGGIVLLIAGFQNLRSQEIADLTAQDRPVDPWLILLGGLTITTLLIAYFYANRKHTRRVADRVEQRAADAQEALRVRDQAIETSYDGIALADLAGNITYANKSQLRMWGYDSLDEVLGKPAEIHWAEVEKARSVGMAMFEKGTWSGEIEAKRRDGTTFPAAISAHTATDKDGKPLCLMVSCRDITERRKSEEEKAQYQLHLEDIVAERTDELKRANRMLTEEIAERKRSEEAVRESEASLAEAQRIAHVGSWDWDIEADIVSFSDEILRIFGLEPGDVSDAYDTFIEAVHPDDRDAVRKAVDDALQGRGPYNMEYRIVRPKGDIRILRSQGLLRCSESGEPTHLLGTLQDITEQKNIEESLRQGQRLEALGTLAGGIAHDFNNILGAIIGFTAMAHQEAPEDSQLKEDLHEVLSAANRAKDLVSQILTFSRQAKEDRKPLRLHHSVEEAIRLLEATLPVSIEIRSMLDKECGVVIADGSQIHQLVINLGTNAYHAMKESGGKLHIGLVQVEVDESLAASEPDLHEGPYAKITVADTGHGMDSSTLHRIYDPFFTTKDSGQGTGMGLSTVHGIVQVHGGAILVESEIGRGTVFQIYLPCVDQAELLDVEETNPIPRGSERILAIDDEAMLLRFLEKALVPLGYSVTAMESSQEAIDLFRSEPNAFDLILTDLSMPGMSGKQLVREALRIRPDVPIVLATGFSEDITNQVAMRMGTRKLILKPYTIRLLAEAVREAVEAGSGAASSGL